MFKCDPLGKTFRVECAPISVTSRVECDPLGGAVRFLVINIVIR